MRTWQIFPIAGGHYRWVPIGGSSDRRNKILQTLAHQVTPPLELLEGSGRVFRTGSDGSATRSLNTKGICVFDRDEPSNLLESHGHKESGRGSVPMFRIRSEKLVSVTERSIKKARSVLDVEDGMPLFGVYGDGPSSLLEAHGPNGSLLGHIEGSNGAGRHSVTMFCTGSGKPVSMTERSMKKARSVLDVEDGVPLFSIKARATSKPLEVHDRVGGSVMPMFCTGSGKPVLVTRSSIEKARSILRGGDDIDSAPSKLQEGHDEEGVGGLPMFHTRHGRSVSVMKNSIDKARCVLHEGINIDQDNGHRLDGGESKDNSFSMFRTGTGKSVSMKESSLRKARTVLEQDAMQIAPSKLQEGPDQDGVGGFPIFHTRLERSVSVMKNSIDKARSVLGDGDNIDRGDQIDKKTSWINGDPQMFRTGSGKPVNIKQSSIRKATTVLEVDNSEKEVLKPPSCGTNDGDVPTFQTGSGKSIRLKESSIRKAMAILQDGENLETELLNPPKCGSNDIPMFQTGSGKSLSLKHSSIRKAMTILQDGENNETVKVQKDLEEASWFKENNSFACFQQSASSHLAKVLPTVPKLTNPIKSALYRNNCDTMKKQKKENGSLLQGYLPSSGPLFDISNSIDKNYENNSILATDKKRPWIRSSISPFKRPRNSRFTTPMEARIK